MNRRELRSEIDERGYVVIDSMLQPQEIDILAQEIDAATANVEVARRGGVRDIFRRLPSARRLIRHPRIVEAVHAVLGPQAFAVRGILFDKSARANWKVPWHQDLTVAVKERTATRGYRGWSSKAGITHVQPPLEVLEGMLAVRIHIDPCGLTNGAVRLLPRTHRLGRLTSAGIARARAGIGEVSCAVSRGGLLLMRPLLLHASSAATACERRRVLHIEFAACELSPEVEWFERWACTP